MSAAQKTKIIASGFVAVAALLLVYVIVATAISGFAFASNQFISYWYFFVSLAAGFGIQIGLYLYLKELVKNSSMQMGRGAVVTTGTTSTLAMLSCCAHYLVNIVPILGMTGLATLVAQYQVKIFWVGIMFNLFGIWFISNKISLFKKHHE